MNKKLVTILSAALLLILVMMLPALAEARVLKNCTIDLTEIAVGDIIQEHVTITDKTGAGKKIHWDNDCNLTLVTTEMKEHFTSMPMVEGCEFIETINSWGWSYTSFTVVSNTAYIKRWENCTIDVSDIAVGDVIGEHVTVTDKDGITCYIHWDNDGNITLLTNQSESKWTYFSQFKDKEMLETFASYGYNYPQLTVVSNIAASKVWKSCTVDITEIMAGDIIAGGVIITDKTGAGRNVHWDNDCNLTLVTDEQKTHWNPFEDLKGKQFIETINGWGNSYTQFKVVSNTAAPKVWCDCTVDITEIAPGDYIGKHVTVTNNKPVNTANICFTDDGDLTLYYEGSSGHWNYFSTMEGNYFLEKCWSWHFYGFSKFKVVSNDCYIHPGIEFDMQDHGTAIEKQDVDEGETGTKPTDPTETGYTFGGWYKEASCTNEYDFENEAVHGVVTVYAKWTANSYTVAFDANGGSGSMADESFVYDEEKALTDNEFTKTGYSFLGWSTNKTAASAEYPDGEKVINLTDEKDGTVTLYAVWGLNDYTVAFDANGGSGSMADESFAYGEEKALTANAFTKTGYTFLGWSTDKTATAAEYADGEKVSNLTDEKDGTVTLYAVWGAGSYTVVFDANGGSGSMADESFAYDEEKALTANAFTRDGYSFLGWSTDKDATAAGYADGEKVSNLTDEQDGTVTLYAVWGAGSYTVVFDANGGSGSMADESFAYDEEKALTANAFTRDGYSFLGWSTDKDATAAGYADGEKVINLTDEQDGTVTLYAVWSLIPCYAVDFEMNGHGTAVVSQTVEEGSKAEKPEDPEEDGYTFTGWYTDAACTAAYDFDTPVTANLTLYAGWEEITVTEIILTPDTLTLKPDETATITAKVLPENAADKTLTWSFDPADVIVMSTDGTIKALKEGTATVTVTAANGVKATATVTVKEDVIPVTAVILTPDTLNMKPGETATITAKVLPENATDKALNWSFDPADVIVMSTDGTIKALKEGTATVTVTAANGVKATAKVTVKADPVSYKMIRGANQTIVQNAESAVFASDAEFSKFVRVEVDGKKLTKGQYKAEEGSTIITLTKKYLSTLSVGLHTLSIISKDGRADTTFTVNAAPPPTGDASTPILWLALSLLGIATLIMLRKKAVQH
ncbi:MAG: InlB B-repeat-containing protein [Clostridia bacterium]|nr:InlB B-repeat-containing protein [Clostridia bacterium]